MVELFTLGLGDVVAPATARPAQERERMAVAVQHHLEHCEKQNVGGNLLVADLPLETLEERDGREILSRFDQPDDEHAQHERQDDEPQWPEHVTRYFCVHRGGLARKRRE